MRRPDKYKKSIVAILLAILAVLPVSAGQKDAYLIIVGPGDPLYTYWGHIGIAIEDVEAGKSSFYDFGNFSFYSENFYSDFAMGRMLYLGMETPTDHFLRYSLLEDRDLVVYPLNLGQEELTILEDRLVWWVLPENREYLYDYFHANCSTIIRDVLDEAVGGALRDASEGMTGRSFRHYARTGADPSLFGEIMLHYLLGPGLDYEIDEWELMFLPEAVAVKSLDLEYKGIDGITRTLAGPPMVLKESTRNPVPEEPRVLWPLMLAAGLVFGILWLLFSAWPVDRRWFAALDITYRVLLTLLVGIPGLVLAFLMLFTDHAAAYSNINLGPTLPTVLLSLVPLFGIIGKRAGERVLREKRIALVWTVNLAALAVVMILRATGLSGQDAFAFWAFFTPLLLSASLPGYMLAGRIRRYLTKEG